MQAAEKYYRVLENAAQENDSEVQDLREQLDRLEEPFADNPAYVAFLRLQRAAKNIR